MRSGIVRKNVFLYSAVVLLVFGTIDSAYGLGSYLNIFNTTYGTSATVLNSCVLCHIDPAGGGTRNPYGTDYANNGHSFPAIAALDSDGDGFTNIVEINARTFPGDATSHPAVVADTTPPTVTLFAVPATSASLTVAVTTFTATDNVAVTGYLITESASVPLATATGWTATPPVNYTFASSGFKTLYAWAKDAAGNISASASASTTISLSDSTAPVITAFIVPVTSSSLVLPITTFTATDNVGVTGHLVTETTTTPSSAPAVGWTATPPATYTFASSGSKTLYAWAKDAAGNISAYLSASTTVSLTDTTAPVVTAFILPATSSSLVLPITTFTATDNVGVTGYLVTETTTRPSPAPAVGWTATPPATHTFASSGSNTLYAWAKDAAGNVSASVSASTTISTTAATPPSTGTDAATTTATPAVDAASGGGGGGGGCFIATAAFGSYLDPYVRILRNFRDTFLITNNLGRAFVTWYYRVSPPIADIIAQGSLARALVRIGLLPLIGFSALALTMGLVPSVLIALLAVAGIGLGTRKLHLLLYRPAK